MIRNCFYIALILFINFSCSAPTTKPIVASRLILEDSTIANNPCMDSMIAPYKQVVDSIATRVIGFSNQEMRRNAPEGLLNNFVSDLMIHQTNLYLNPLGEAPVQISLMNNHGLRAPLPKGAVTIDNVFEIMPFENMLTLVEIKGSDLQNVIDSLCAHGGLGMGGVRVTVENNKATRILIHGKALNPSAIYRMVTSDFVSQGGDHLLRSSQMMSCTDLGITIRDAIIEEIEGLTKMKQPITATLDGRVNVK